MSNSLVKRVQFEEKLFALGEGISLQLGSLIKIKQLRIGLSYTTPTLLKIEEELGNQARFAGALGLGPKNI